MRLLKIDDFSQTTNKFDSEHKRSRKEKVKELIHYRYLLRNLVIRDLKARYKNSSLGIIWSLINPILMMIVYTVLFTILLKADRLPNYPVFILIGLVPWQFHTGTLSSGTSAIISNASLVKKVYFPRILLPLSTILSNLVNYLISFSLILILVFVFRIGITIHILWVPAILFTQLVFMTGLVLIFCSLNTFYRDVSLILDVLLTAWFFLTPIIYPLEDLQQQTSLLGLPFNAARVMRWVNPMASIVDGYRTVLWGNVDGGGPGSMDPLNLIRTLVTSLIVLFIGYIAFSRTEHLFGERL